MEHCKIVTQMKVEVIKKFVAGVFTCGMRFIIGLLQYSTVFLIHIVNALCLATHD